MLRSNVPVIERLGKVSATLLDCNVSATVPVTGTPKVTMGTNPVSVREPVPGVTLTLAVAVMVGTNPDRVRLATGTVTVTGV